MFELQYRRQKLNYSVRKRNALMIDNVRGRRPDIEVVDRPLTRREERRPGIRTAPKLNRGDSLWRLEYKSGGEAGGRRGAPDTGVLDCGLQRAVQRADSSKVLSARKGAEGHCPAAK